MVEIASDNNKLVAVGGAASNYVRTVMILL